MENGKWKIKETRCTDKNGKGNEISKWKNGKIMVKWTEVKDEKSRWGNDRKINMENCKQCFGYSIGYSIAWMSEIIQRQTKVTLLVIFVSYGLVIMQDGIRSLNSEVIRLFGTAKYIQGYT